ncbi:MAG: Ig-like domain-containing protein [Gammaproteobacteria bacterium]|jgi:dipeptidyl aminopeptidase/acylaminoacyl peptidase
MAQTQTSDKNRWLLIVSVMALGLISLVQHGCDSDSSNVFVPASPSIPTPPPLPSAITAVSPLQNSDTALVSALVSASFSNDMNGATFTTSTFTLTTGGAPVTANVSYDVTTKTATLTPASDLVTATEYRATISSVVEDAAGTRPLTADFVWSFTISPATALVSKDSNAVVGNDVSARSAIDASGRYIVFESEATNLASAATTFNRNHIYRKDTVSGEVVLVSSDAAGLEANNNSASPRISDDGRYVVFESLATNLSSISTGGTRQVYLKDLADDSVDLVSRTTDPVVADNSAENPDVSNDGRYIVFESNATNLSALGTTGASQIYRKDMTDDTIDMISRNTTQTAGGNGSSNRPHMSADARYIVFDSAANDISVAATSSVRSVYLIDVMNPDTIELISVDTLGTQGNGASIGASISDDGNFIAFESQATNLIAGGTTLSDIYRRDRSRNQTLLVSTPDGIISSNDASVGASINGDGRYVAFVSAATNLVTETSLGLNDIFVRDLSTLPTVTLAKINLTQTGAEATDNSANASISSDGRYVSFDSAFNYDISDTNTINDIYRSLNSTF